MLIYRHASALIALRSTKEGAALLEQVLPEYVYVKPQAKESPTHSSEGSGKSNSSMMVSSDEGIREYDLNKRVTLKHLKNWTYQN